MDIIDLQCATFDGAAGVSSLIAMDVGSDLQIVKSNHIALKSFGDTVVARLRLSAGRYLVCGKAALLNFDGDPQDATVALATRDGAVVLTSMRVRLERNGDGHAQSVVARAVFDAADGDFIDLRCTSFNGDASDVILTAVSIDDVVTGGAVNDEPDGRYYSCCFPVGDRAAAQRGAWCSGFGYMLSPPSGRRGSAGEQGEAGGVVVPAGAGLVASPPR